MKALILKHVACEGPGLLEDVLREKGIDYRVADARPDKLPDARGIDLLVAMGGPMSANDARMQPEVELVANHVKQGKPYLGICLGAQILAKALGGEVYKSPIKEIGRRTVWLTAEGQSDPVFESWINFIEAFQWHGETFTVPNGATLLGVTYYSPLRYPSETTIPQAFRMENAVGLQFHLEATFSMVRQWVKEYPEDLAEVGRSKRSLLKDFRLFERPYHYAAQEYFGRFLEQVKNG